MNLPVDVISDVICPWCFIGKRRLEKAIAAHGISRREYRIRKFGSWERSMQLDANIVATGKDEGILFDFDRMERTPNTLNAHRLIWLADMDGVQDAVVEALFRAYFTEGRDISHPQTLIGVVAEAGLDRKRAEAVLDGDEGMEAIKEAGEQAQRLRVDSVPYFVVNGKIALSGAQHPDTLLEAFRQAVSSTPLHF